MSLLPILCALCATVFIKCVEPARILVFIPTPCYSHQLFYRPLWIELAKRGHQVVLAAADPIKEPVKNLEQIDLSIGYKHWNVGVSQLVAGNDQKLSMIANFVTIISTVLEAELQLESFQKIIQDKEQKFDLVFAESFYPVLFALKRRFNCSLIGMASLDAPEYVHRFLGNAVHTLMYPTRLVPFDDEKTFLERVATIGIHKTFHYFMETHNEKNMERMIRAYIIPDYSFEGTYDLIDLAFVNTNPVFQTVRPHTPSTISVYGLHQTPPKPLPQNLKEFLDSSPEGVIYFSLGGTVKGVDIPLETRNIFLKTFAELPYKVLWKFEADSMPGKPENVRIEKWLPQQDVLSHKNIKVFITQGGIQSLEESLYARVPVVIVPLFVDQEGNGRRAVQKGLGVQINYQEMTVESFKSSIIEVIRNPKYKQTMIQYMNRIEDQPMTPLETAVWWTEYILRHKDGSHLKGPRIPDYQYYYFDIFACLILIVCIILGLVYCLIRKIYLSINRPVELKVKRN